MEEQIENLETKMEQGMEDLETEIEQRMTDLEIKIMSLESDIIKSKETILNVVGNRANQLFNAIQNI